MDAKRQQQIENLYLNALQRGSGERSAFLREACRGDEALARDVEARLAAAAVPVADVPAGRSVAIHLSESTVTQLTAGAHLGRYRIEALLGVGGMGQSTALPIRG